MENSDYSNAIEISTLEASNSLIQYLLKRQCKFKIIIVIATQRVLFWRD